MAGTKTVLPYGMWPSPISAAMTSQGLRLEDVQWDSDGHTLLWLEGRSGRGVLVAHPEGEARRDLTVDQSVRSFIGYGGGEFTIQRGKILFSSSDGRLYRHGLEPGFPRPLIPPFGSAASPRFSPDGQWVVYVFSDGHTDLIALVDSEGKDWPVKLVSGADFYMQPTFSPNGEFLAWVEWDHPNMPWDGSRIQLGRLKGAPPKVVEQSLVAGDKVTSTSQPEFSPDGRWLSYITSKGDWEDLVVMDLASGKKQVLVSGDQFLLSLPAWVQGMRSYGWSFDSKKIYYLRNFSGQTSLWVVELASGRSTWIDTSPYTWITQLSVSPLSDRLAFLSSAPDISPRVVCWDGRQFHVEARSTTECIPAELLSGAEEFRWTAEDGTSVYAHYYAPKNATFTGTGAPPAILHIHGGPTSLDPVRFDAEAAYFTSRGYAWVNVNYRGSSGYGRSYMNALREHWGDLDSVDAAGAAQRLAELKLADPKKLVLMGGSAGGFTVLNTLAQYPGLFKAGVCRYGVSNLFTIAMETHKFEAHYTDSLVGPLPEAAARYHAWSPVFRADKIRDPLAIFQGSADKAVPPAQSEEIVNILRQNGVPHVYRVYEGEGHGFRKAENLQDYYTQAERFLQQYVLFAD